MGIESVRDYVRAIWQRYHGANRKYKKLILTEFCQVAGIHRKHAIRLLRKAPVKRAKRRGAKPKYGADVARVLQDIWLASNRLCSKLLKAAIPIWLPFYEERNSLTPALREHVLQISPATMDRLLKPSRRQYGSRGRCGTKPGSLLKHQIPIKTNQADVHKPGFVEADTVAHCDDSIEGNFVWSLTFTDIFSGWTENRAVWNKGYEGVKLAIENIESELPFSLLGFQSDNGGEFLNYHLFRYFSERNLPVGFTRGRPHHKNDNAHVEQKNWSRVRQLLGYQRIENPELIPPINTLYRTWSAYHNFFCPTLKLATKNKEGSRYVKTYETPQTPYQRLMASTDVLEPAKIHLGVLFSQLNPYALKKQIDYHQRRILSQLR